MPQKYKNITPKGSKRVKVFGCFEEQNGNVQKLCVFQQKTWFWALNKSCEIHGKSMVAALKMFVLGAPKELEALVGLFEKP